MLATRLWRHCRFHLGQSSLVCFWSVFKMVPEEQSIRDQAWFGIHLKTTLRLWNTISDQKRFTVNNNDFKWKSKLWTVERTRFERTRRHMDRHLRADQSRFWWRFTRRFWVKQLRDDNSVNNFIFYSSLFMNKIECSCSYLVSDLFGDSDVGDIVMLATLWLIWDVGGRITMLATFFFMLVIFSMY